MWRILDLRKGVYLSVISITGVEDWEYDGLLNGEEGYILDDICGNSIRRYPLHISQSEMDKQQMIEDLISNHHNNLQYFDYTNQVYIDCKDLVRWYLNDCIIETYIEFPSKKKALLEVHKRFAWNRTGHFYEAVDVEGVNERTG